MFPIIWVWLMKTIATVGSRAMPHVKKAGKFALKHLQQLLPSFLGATSDPVISAYARTSAQNRVPDYIKEFGNRPRMATKEHTLELINIESAKVIEHYNEVARQTYAKNPDMMNRAAYFTAQVQMNAGALRRDVKAGYRYSDAAIQKYFRRMYVKMPSHTTAPSDINVKDIKEH